MNGAAMQVTADWLSAQFPNLCEIRPLSTGGQKLVFSAKHPDEGDVVLKLLKPSQDIERTSRESLAVARVQAARVPCIHEHGTIQTPVGDHLWFREQRIHGQTVAEILAKSGAFEAVSLLRLGFQVLEIIVAAERVNIVHRDVKPHNIIRAADGDFWLIDFGLARHLDLHSLTATASPWGNFTLGYAPPEQYRNMKLDIDSRCDLFAVGITLYECACGWNPFVVGARDPHEIIQRIEREPLPRLSLSFAKAGPFADLVQALTQKRRDHRPATANEAFEWMREIWEFENS